MRKASSAKVVLHVVDFLGYFGFRLFLMNCVSTSKVFLKGQLRSKRKKKCCLTSSAG